MYRLFVGAQKYVHRQMVRAVQLQQTEKLGKVRTTGTTGVRPDWHHGARSSVSRAKRLAVVGGGKSILLIFVYEVVVRRTLTISLCTRYSKIILYFTYSITV